MRMGSEVRRVSREARRLKEGGIYHNCEAIVMAGNSEGR